MAGNTELVSLRVSEVGAIVVFVVLGPQAWCSFRCASVRESDCEGVVHHGPALSEKRDHLAVAWILQLPVKGPADEEEWPRTGMRLPACPRTTTLAEAGLDPKSSHQGAIERERAIEILDANEDV